MITNDKEAFQVIRNHLLTQMEKSVDTGSTCLYRGYSEKIRILAEDAARVETGNDVLDYDYDILYEHLNAIGPDLKCAVGAIISDQHYDYDIEESGFDNLLVQEAVEKSNPNWNLKDSSIGMLMILQMIHDVSDVDLWTKNLKESNYEFDDNGNFIQVTFEEHPNNSWMTRFKENDYVTEESYSYYGN